MIAVSWSSWANGVNDTRTRWQNPLTLISLITSNATVFADGQYPMIRMISLMVLSVLCLWAAFCAVVVVDTRRMSFTIAILIFIFSRSWSQLILVTHPAVGRTKLVQMSELSCSGLARTKRRLFCRWLWLKINKLFGPSTAGNYPCTCRR